MPNTFKRFLLKLKKKGMNKDIITWGREVASYFKNCRQQLKGALLELRNAESGKKSLPWEEHTNWLFNTSGHL